jgi:hypothetical protein
MFEPLTNFLSGMIYWQTAGFSACIASAVLLVVILWKDDA